MLNTIIEKPPLRIYDYSDYDDYSDNDEEVGIIQNNYNNNRRETFIDKIINCVAYCDRGVEYFFQALEWLDFEDIRHVRKNICVCIILSSPFMLIYYSFKNMIFL